MKLIPLNRIYSTFLPFELWLLISYFSSFLSFSIISFQSVEKMYNFDIIEQCRILALSNNNISKLNINESKVYQFLLNYNQIL
jgi:hypothetical protein